MQDENMNKEEVTATEPAMPEITVPEERIEVVPGPAPVVCDPFEIVVAPTAVNIPEDVAFEEVTKEKKEKKKKEKKQKEKGEKKPKKWLLPLIISVVIALVAAAAVVAGLMTDWFGLAAEKKAESALNGPLGPLADAVIATAKADSLTAETDASVDFSEKEYEDSQSEANVRYYFNAKKKKIVLISEIGDVTEICDGDKMYRLTENGTSAIEETNTDAAFDLISAIRSGDEESWRDFVKSAELSEYVNAKKAGKIITLLSDKYLCDEEWLSENLGFENNGDEYIFEFESSELFKTLVGIADEAGALEMKAKKVEKAVDENVVNTTFCITVTVDDGFVSAVSIEAESDELTLSAEISISDVNETKYDEKEIKNLKKKVEEAVEEQSTPKVCAWCGNDESVELDGEVYVCSSCYEELVVGECDGCGAADMTLCPYEGEYYCLDCYIAANDTVPVCALCGEEAELVSYEGRDFCETCYENVKNGEEYYDECSSCSAFAEMKYYGGSYYCEECYDTVRYGTDSYQYCDYCHEYGSLTEYGNYELCDECIWTCYICDICGDLTEEYENIDGTYYCPDCSSETEFDDHEYCELCGEYEEAWYYGGHDFCYDCYSEVKYGDDIYDECEICGKFTVLQNYEGTLYCEDCYSNIDVDTDGGHVSLPEGADSYVYTAAETIEGATTSITMYADGGVVKSLYVYASQSTDGATEEEISLVVAVMEMMFSTYDTIDGTVTVEGDQIIAEYTFGDLDTEAGLAVIADLQMFDIADCSEPLSVEIMHELILDEGFVLVS